MRTSTISAVVAAFVISGDQKCSSFSALAPSFPPSSASASSPLNGIFAAPLEKIKRSSLKKQLIKAATDKNEEVVISLVDEISVLNPNKFATYGLGGYGGGKAKDSPLNGEWRLLFTNAKDAEAPARTEKKSGGEEVVAEGVQITTGQRIVAAKGECINYIYASGEKAPFDQLEISIKMTALTPNRVRLDFQRGRAQNERAPLSVLKDVSFSFPPAFVGDALSLLRGRNPSIEPPAYFDVLYIDDEIRAHRTGEGKIFVQMRK
mmetsp:Transcript_27207/g.80242  ORF Transcript_27207/g.80242 Transcript_27207/m.80242 type:complete len:263 (-) Transcript_27207:50-838(-)